MADQAMFKPEDEVFSHIAMGSVTCLQSRANEWVQMPCLSWWSRAVGRHHSSQNKYRLGEKWIESTPSVKDVGVLVDETFYMSW